MAKKIVPDQPPEIPGPAREPEKPVTLPEEPVFPPEEWPDKPQPAEIPAPSEILEQTNGATLNAIHETY